MPDCRNPDREHRRAVSRESHSFPRTGLPENVMKNFFKKGIDNPQRRVYKWHMKGNGVFEYTLRGAFSFMKSK